MPRRLFRQGPFDRQLGGLQQGAVNRLQQELGSRLQRSVPAPLQRLMPGQFNPFIPGSGKGSGGAAAPGSLLDRLRRR